MKDEEQGTWGKLDAMPKKTSEQRSPVERGVICPTCRRKKEKCNCEYCHNCTHYSEDVCSNLDGNCTLSMDYDNNRMVANDMGHPEEPVLNVSIVFSCNQWRGI